MLSSSQSIISSWVHKKDLTLLVDHDYLEHNKGDHKDDLTLLVDPPGVCQLVDRLPALHEEAVPQFILVPRGSTPYKSNYKYKSSQKWVFIYVCEFPAKQMVLFIKSFVHLLMTFTNRFTITDEDLEPDVIWGRIEKIGMTNALIYKAREKAS